MTAPPAIVWREGRLELLDQRRLPHRIEYLAIDSPEGAVDAIRTLAVRGAPAIGIAAAYALAACVDDGPQFAADVERVAAMLAGARPTAVNLRWALDRMRRASVAGSRAALVREAEAIHAEDRAMCRAIGAHGRALIKPGANVLTHCNAGSLAVSELGTATAPLYLSHAAGVPFHVWVGETRPLLQGARLTAFELAAAGIDVTLVCDNMAASLMADGRVDLVMVGTDRVTRNGDVVNKIGTLGLAVLANHFEIPFWVACPWSTYDAATPDGTSVVIEQRNPGEVLGSEAARVRAHNPAFDVTPAALVTGIVTDRGIARATINESLGEALARLAR